MVAYPSFNMTGLTGLNAVRVSSNAHGTNYRETLNCYLFRSTGAGLLIKFPSSRNCAFIFSICSFR
jgi:hypothetical protein